MLQLRAFDGHVVVTDHAAAVVAPPYDALSPEARRAVAASDPDSYLGALPPGGESGAGPLDAALHRCRAHLDRLLDAGRFRRLARPSLAVLALGAEPHRTVAIVGDLPVAAFADGRVLPHEDVRPDRVDQLARYLEVVGVASSPVAVTQRPHPAVPAATTAVLRTPPGVAFRDGDGTDVALWVVDDPDAVERLTAAVAVAGRGYVADGHHRAAAVARFAEAHGIGPDRPGGRILTAVIPADQLVVQPFHRRVACPLDPGEVQRRLEAAGFAVEALDGPGVPERPGTVHLAVGGRWLAADGAARTRPDDPVEVLDVRLVDRDLLPALGIDPVDAEPVAAPLGLSPLVAPGRLGIALHPAAIEDVLAVADAGLELPAKTTYVTPKLRSGVVVTPRPSAPASPPPTL